jgi:hypothetical protein
LAEFKQLLDIMENDFLADGGPLVHGERCGVADIYSIWMIKQAFQSLGVGSEPGFSRENFPKVYQWIKVLPEHNEQNDAPKTSAVEAKKQLLSARYAAKEIGADSRDPTGLKAGSTVTIETNDEKVTVRSGETFRFLTVLSAKPGNTKQLGKLVGLIHNQIVIELENGIRSHFSQVRLCAEGCLSIECEVDGLLETSANLHSRYPVHILHDGTIDD